MKTVKQAAKTLRFCGFDARADYQTGVVIIKNLDQSKKAEIKSMVRVTVKAA